MLGNREKAAMEQSRGESASAQGWRTNNNKEEVCVGVGERGGGGQWLGPCFGNVNEAGNFLSVPFLRVNRRAAPRMSGRFVLGMPAEQRGALKIRCLRYSTCTAARAGCSSEPAEAGGASDASQN